MSVKQAGSPRPFGAKPFEPARPERLSKAETPDDGSENPVWPSHTVRSAPGRSEREAGAIVDLLYECKFKWIGTVVITGLVPVIPNVEASRSSDRDGRDETGHD